jgi:hypothetical protein
VLTLANGHAASLEQVEAHVAPKHVWDRVLTSLSRLAMCPWALSWKEDMAMQKCVVGGKVEIGRECWLLKVFKLFVCESGAVMIVRCDGERMTLRRMRCCTH